MAYIALSTSDQTIGLKLGSINGNANGVWLKLAQDVNSEKMGPCTNSSPCVVIGLRVFGPKYNI